MTILERVNYLKGLIDGLDLDKKDDTNRVVLVMAEILEEMAIDMEMLAEDLDDTMDLAEELDEDLAEGEDYLLEEEDLCDCDCDDCDNDCDSCDCGCGCDDEDFDFDGELYEVTCPSCGDEICVDEDTLELGSIPCPNCGEELEFDMDFLFEDEDEIDD